MDELPAEVYAQNAPSSTPPEGFIAITPHPEEDRADILVEDTGSGLGLCIVKLTAEELCGTISDQSRPSGGVVIRLALPASE